MIVILGLMERGVFSSVEIMPESSEGAEVLELLWCAASVRVGWRALCHRPSPSSHFHHMFFSRKMLLKFRGTLGKRAGGDSHHRYYITVPIARDKNHKCNRI